MRTDVSRMGNSNSFRYNKGVDRKARRMIVFIPRRKSLDDNENKNADKQNKEKSENAKKAGKEFGIE